MKSNISGAALSLTARILGLTGGQILIGIYKYCSPEEVGALTSIFGALIFTISMVIQQQGKITPKIDKKALRSHWIMIAIMVCVSLPETQLNQFALDGAGLGVLTAVTSAGLLAVTTWRLVFAEGGVRPWHAIWQLIALGGVILLVQPYTGHGPSAGGMAAAILIAAAGIVFVICGVRLAQLELQPLTIALLRWAGVLVAAPILALGDQRWMNPEVLGITAASALLTVMSNWSAVSANKAARSDGVIAAVTATGPVLAVIVAIIAGQAAPGPSGWVGASLVVAASIIAVRILSKREHDHPKITQ